MCGRLYVAMAFNKVSINEYHKTSNWQILYDGYVQKLMPLITALAKLTGCAERCF